MIQSNKSPRSANSCTRMVTSLFVRSSHQAIALDRIRVNDIGMVQCNRQTRLIHPYLRIAVVCDCHHQSLLDFFIAPYTLIGRVQQAFLVCSCSYVVWMEDGISRLSLIAHRLGNNRGCSFSRSARNTAPCAPAPQLFTIRHPQYKRTGRKLFFVQDDHQKMAGVDFATLDLAAEGN